jgi:hypothetical protein
MFHGTPEDVLDQHTSGRIVGTACGRQVKVRSDDVRIGDGVPVEPRDQSRVAGEVIHPPGGRALPRTLVGIGVLDDGVVHEHFDPETAVTEKRDALVFVEDELARS